jgi:hypothetical protein
MEPINPKQTKIEEITLNIDMLAQQMKNMPEEEKVKHIPRLQSLSKEYHLYTGLFYRP